jgi:hypothetical protein
MTWKSILAAAAALALAACSAPLQSPFAFTDVSQESLEVSENGQPVFVYNHGMILAPGVDPKYRRSSYLHPIHAPDGTVLTDDFPEDHPHHRGLCWTWPEVTVEGKTHDVWAVRGMHQRFGQWLRRELRPNLAILAMENGWYVDGDDERVVKETVEITVHPAEGNRRMIEFRLTFEATGKPITIAGREKKGYGGFGVRFAPRTDTVLRTDAGVEEKDSDMVPHPWAELEATFGGRRAGMRIEDVPGNPGGGPVGWCLRHYGYVAANYPGPEPVPLEPGKPLVLNYRVTVFSAT